MATTRHDVRARGRPIGKLTDDAAGLSTLICGRIERMTERQGLVWYDPAGKVYVAGDNSAAIRNATADYVIGCYLIPRGRLLGGASIPGMIADDLVVAKREWEAQCGQAVAA